jgi:hypothetical protein
MHVIYIPENDVRIPLQMLGVISLFHTRRPSNRELETCQWLVITSDLDWDPHTTEFEDNKNAVNQGDARAPSYRSIYSVSTSLEDKDNDNHLSSISLNLDDMTFLPEI